MSHFILTLIFSFFFLINDSYAEKVIIFGSLKNGSSGGIGRADSIRLIALQSSMVPIADLSAQSGSFRFPQLEVPDGSPLLVQVVYKGVNYNKMVPPVPKFRNSSQEVTVYELTDIWEDVKIKNLMQVIREKNGLRIFKLFLIENVSKPPKSYLSDTKQIEYFIPKGAKEVFAQIQQPGSKMAIPLPSLDGKKGGKILDRALLPGVSEMQISYMIPNEMESIEERLLLEGDSGTFPVFVKPKEMEVEVVSGGNVSRLERDIPAGLSAYSIEVTSNPKILFLKFNGGKPMPTVLSGNPEIINGTFLTSWDTSLFAVIGFLALLFSFSFVLVYRKSRKEI